MRVSTTSHAILGLRLGAPQANPRGFGMREIRGIDVDSECVPERCLEVLLGNRFGTRLCAGGRRCRCTLVSASVLRCRLERCRGASTRGLAEGELWRTGRVDPEGRRCNFGWFITVQAAGQAFLHIEEFSRFNGGPNGEIKLRKFLAGAQSAARKLWR